MKQISYSLQKHIQSGEYFEDARNWYNIKYLYPLTERSFFILSVIIILMFSFSISITLYSAFPIIKRINYTISSKINNAYTRVIHANYLHDPLTSVIDIMLRNYIVHRERYNYDRLESQLNFMLNNSSRLVYRKFTNLMDIDNPLSPIVRYQDYIRRYISINSVKYLNNDQAEITFESKAEDNNGKLVEHMLWKSIINFEIDNINTNLAPNSRFYFTVTNYQIELLQNKLN